MVFEGLKKFVGGRRDPFDVKGLEQFTPAQQERILGKIASKEAEILETKAGAVAARRIERLEQKAGLGPRKGLGLKKKLGAIKEFRQGNLARQAARTKQFKQREEDFRAGKLDVKPVGPPPVEQKTTGKLDVKPIKLRAPGRSLM